MEYATPFEEGGYRFEAWEPANDAAAHHFIVRVFRGEDKVREETVPMSHPNAWGVDVEDVQALEEATERLVKELVV